MSVFAGSLVIHVDMKAWAVQQRAARRNQAACEGMVLQGSEWGGDFFWPFFFLGLFFFWPLLLFFLRNGGHGHGAGTAPKGAGGRPEGRAGIPTRIYTSVHLQLLCIYLYIYTGIHIYKYIPVYKFSSIPINPYTYMHIYIYTYIHICIYAYIHNIYIYTYIHK